MNIITILKEIFDVDINYLDGKFPYHLRLTKKVKNFLGQDTFKEYRNHLSGCPDRWCFLDWNRYDFYSSRHFILQYALTWVGLLTDRYEKYTINEIVNETFRILEKKYLKELLNEVGKNYDDLPVSYIISDDYKKIAKEAYSKAQMEIDELGKNIKTLEEWVDFANKNNFKLLYIEKYSKYKNILDILKKETKDL